MDASTTSFRGGSVNNCNDNEVIAGMAPVSHSYPVNDYELPDGVVMIMDDDLCPHLVDAVDGDIDVINGDAKERTKSALVAIGHVGFQVRWYIATLTCTYIKPHVKPQPEQWRGQGKRRMKRVK